MDQPPTTMFTVKWSPKQAEKKLAVARQAIGEQEPIVFLGVCNNLRPLVDTIAVTESRFLVMSQADVKLAMPLTEIHTMDSVPAKERLEVRLQDGTGVLLKMVPADDHPTILECCRRTSTAPGGLPAAKVDGPDETLSQSALPAPHPGAAGGGTARFSKLGQSMKDAYDATTKTVRDGFADPPPPGHDAEVHGPLLRKAEVGMKTIELYEGGFVRAVGMMGSLGKPTFERLVSIKYRESTYTRDQSALGSALVTGFTLGMASNENVVTTGTITIVTEKDVYSGEIAAKHGRVFEALGDRILGERERPPVDPPTPAGADIPDQIRKLADLHAAGILTDDEFAAKKAALLDRM